MKTIVFASRNAKEILRDPLNLAFGIGFPVGVLLLLTALQANIPVSLFELDQLTPGIAVFGLSFISLFSGMLIAKDRSSSFLMRLFTSPMKASHFLNGYALPLVLMAFAQSTLCFVIAILLGLTISIHMLLALVVLLPTALLYISIGILAGTVLSDKQVGGFCGALLTNLSAWLSGVWFDLNLVGGAFKAVADILPFVHAVDAARSALAGQYQNIMSNLLVVILYSSILFALAIVMFRKKMRSD